MMNPIPTMRLMNAWIALVHCTTDLMLLFRRPIRPYARQSVTCVRGILNRILPLFRKRKITSRQALTLCIRQTSILMMHGRVMSLAMLWTSRRLSKSRICFSDAAM